MPRRARLIIPDVPHHVTQRGNNRQPVFLSPGDYRFYLDLLGRHARLCGARILGYCLMTNHVHLVIAPEKEQSLARTLGRTHAEYALALNRAEGRSGHIWQNRFFSCPMSNSHTLGAMRYVELNPVRAGLAAAAWEWPWSSARAHAVDNATDAVLDCRWTEYFDRWDFNEWKEILAAGAPDEECAAVRRATRTGEPLGSRTFLADLERRIGKRLLVLERGRPRRKPRSPEDAALQGRLFAASGE
ncbi:MAG: transposase [Acidobacteriia bacterium]|nr:transposase [Terriglobia bacterium]